MKNLILAVLVALSTCGTSFAASPSTSVPSHSAPAGKIRYADLTPDEREILMNGEVGTGQYIAGGIIGTLLGFGIGQAIEGRYMPTGLIFTVGEAASIALMVAGVEDCVTTLVTSNSSTCHNGLWTAGAVALVGLRIWEIIDVWAAPPTINSRYNSLKSRVEDYHSSFRLSPILHGADGEIDGAGLALRLRF